MKSTRPPFPIEVLESRIAPANLFISATDLTAHKSGANGASADDTASATAAHSTVAVDLFAGDKLIYDFNNNHAIDAGEIPLFSITQGSAIAFFTDLNGSAKFDLTKFTGLALPPGAKPSVTADGGTIGTAVTKTADVLT